MDDIPNADHNLDPLENAITINAFRAIPGNFLNAKKRKDDQKDVNF